MLDTTFQTDQVRWPKPALRKPGLAPGGDIFEKALKAAGNVSDERFAVFLSQIIPPAIIVEGVGQHASARSILISRGSPAVISWSLGLHG